MLLGLALLTGVGYLLVSATGRSWFEHDVQMRAELAVRGARPGLVSRSAARYCLRGQEEVDELLERLVELRARKAIPPERRRRGS